MLNTNENYEIRASSFVLIVGRGVILAESRIKL